MEPFQTLITIVLGIVTGIRLFYWLYFFRRIKAPSVRSSTADFPVTVIVCARNEAENLRSLIPLLLAQDYKHYEVIIVDDGSTDESKELAKMYAPDVRWLEIPHSSGHKKKALAYGISHAESQTLLLTDADCRPGPGWISSMANAKGENEVVLGFAPMIKERGWISLLSQFETLVTAMQYLSLALAGRPYMGVGRNLMYDKKLFDAVDGFNAHTNILSGDDDLFIQSIKGKGRIGVCLDNASFVYSRSESEIIPFFKQKRRHLSTAPQYDAGSAFILGLFAASVGLWYILLVLCLVMGFVIWPVLCYIVFMAATAWVNRGVFRILDAGEWVVRFPLFDPILGAYYGIMAIVYPFFGRSKSWE